MSVMFCMADFFIFKRNVADLQLRLEFVEFTCKIDIFNTEKFFISHPK